jgi:hypothetical protein
MKIKLYFDEDSIQHSLTRALRARGTDVITSLDADLVAQPDSVHLDYATQNGRVLCSFNVGDFYRLHTEYLNSGRTHTGVVLMRQQHYSVGEVMRRMLKLIANKTADDMCNTVEFLSAWK